MDSLVDVNDKTLYYHLLHYFHTFFTYTCPECRFSFRVFLLCVFFFKSFPCFLLVQNVGHFPAPPHTHTYGQFGALSQAPTQPPPQTICLICFVFSNELDVKFNTLTHSYVQKKHCAELFLFEFFDSQSRKLLKRVKVSQKK